ncbi:MAG: Uma2 family endonuclease [Chloroflexi bacterium]|nr:Uma2 family endonuclease [Chloroflexota bacterium]
MTIQEPTIVPTILDILPAPGEWTEAFYYIVSERGRLVELSSGNLEILPMPTDYHQLILGRLFIALFTFANQYKLGQVRFAPLPVRLWPGKIREPDILFMSAAHADRIEKYWGVPDLVVEIISEGDAKRDRTEKPEDYAQAEIPEYWIVDPETKTLDVLRLEGESYKLLAHLAENDMITSPTFPGFTYALKDLFAPA